MRENAHHSVAGIVGMRSRHRATRYATDCGQRCAAAGFIKQLYLDRLWSYGLKVRAINSQSSARAEGDAGACGTPAEKYLFSLDLSLYIIYICTCILTYRLRLFRQYRTIILIMQFRLCDTDLYLCGISKLRIFFLLLICESF